MSRTHKRRRRAPPSERPSLSRDPATGKKIPPAVSLFGDSDRRHPLDAVVANERSDPAAARPATQFELDVDTNWVAFAPRTRTAWVARTSEFVMLSDLNLIVYRFAVSFFRGRQPFPLDPGLLRPAERRGRCAPDDGRVQTSTRHLAFRLVNQRHYSRAARTQPALCRDSQQRDDLAASGSAGPARSRAYHSHMGTNGFRTEVAGVALTLGAAAVATAAMAPWQHEIGLLNEGLIFLLLTLVVAGTWGYARSAFSLRSSPISR